jgi:YgiT-type zinc finger domain-containing protein
MPIIVEPNDCWNCEDGKMIRTLTTHIFDLADGKFIRVEDIVIDICNKCGEQTFDNIATQKIEDAIEAKYPGYYDSDLNDMDADDSLASFLEDFPHDSM